MSAWTLLNSKKDFHWYKARLDVENQTEHRHKGEPKEYPAKVRSAYDDYYDDGPSTFAHEFIYQQKVTCEHCGHSKTVWPEVESEAK